MCFRSLRQRICYPALTEVAILVAAREFDIQYVWSAHEPNALRAGVAQPVIDVIKYGKDVSGLGEKETVIIRMGRQLFREHKLNPDTFAKAVELFGKQGTVELVTLMGDYTLNGLLLAALTSISARTGRRFCRPGRALVACPHCAAFGRIG